MTLKPSETFAVLTIPSSMWTGAGYIFLHLRSHYPPWFWQSQQLMGSLLYTDTYKLNVSAKNACCARQCIVSRDSKALQGRPGSHSLVY